MQTMTPPRTKTIGTLDELRRQAINAGPKRIGVVQADDEVALTAAAEALRQGIAYPVLIGDACGIREHALSLGLMELVEHAEFIQTASAATTAVRLARDGTVEILLKGHLRTDELLHPVLDRQNGLRTGRLLCDVAVFELASENGVRLVAMSDGGINVLPTLEQKKQIVLAGCELLRSLGITSPKVAVLSALEVVIDAMPSTQDAAELTAMGAAGVFGDAQVYGPLALDNALLEWAARAKGIVHPVAGHADFLLVPNIEAGNLLAKSVIFLAHRPFAHVVVGAQVPILIPSRVESAQDKVNSMALGVLYAAR